MANKNSSSEKPARNTNEDQDMNNDQDRNIVDEALFAAMNDAEDNASTDPQGGQNVEQLQATVAELRKRNLMAQAELENFRKRSRRELSEQLRYAAMPLIKDLLPVIDNFQRAMESSESDAESSNVLAGIGMVQRMLSDVLVQHGCHRIGEVGDEFDPMVHEAIGHQNDASVPANHVLQVVQNGYRLHDRIVRPTHVIVSKGPNSH